MPGDMAIVRGEIVPVEQAFISVLDLGFLRGVGVFETVRTYEGQPYALQEHLDRLWASTGVLGIAPQFDAARIRPLLRQAYEATGHDEVRFNIVVTPGEHTNGVFGAEAPTWVMLVKALTPPSAANYTDGTGVVTYEAQRVLPEIKSTNYLVGVHGLQRARQVGASEALYVDPDGFVTEGVTSNVLFLKDGVVVTPDQDCLAGITRNTLKEIVERLGLQWRFDRVRVADLLDADEVWLASSVRELMPVVRIDGTPVADGTVGPWARRLGPELHRVCVESARADAVSSTT